MKFYSVMTKVYDDFRMEAEFVKVIEKDEKPKPIIYHTPKFSSYMDFFNTKEEAELYIDGIHRNMPREYMI